MSEYKELNEKRNMLLKEPIPNKKALMAVDKALKNIDRSIQIIKK